MTDKKTVAQIVTEHQKRQEKPEFSTLVFGDGRTYHNITNLREVGKSFREYEFDSEWNGKITHVCIATSPTIKEKFVEYVPGYTEVIAEHCCLVLVQNRENYKSEEFTDVYDLKENVKNKTVEFDFIENGKRCHLKMNGRITKYIESFDEENGD